jgi:hypothetical protein
VSVSKRKKIYRKYQQLLQRTTGQLVSPLDNGHKLMLSGLNVQDMHCICDALRLLMNQYPLDDVHYRLMHLMVDITNVATTVTRAGHGKSC